MVKSPFYLHKLKPTPMFLLPLDEMDLTTALRPGLGSQITLNN